MKLILSVILVLLASITYSQNYSKVKIYTNDIGLQQLAELGLPVDHGIRKKGHFFISDFSEAEIELIASSGVMFDIIIDYVKEFYKNRNDNPVAKNVKKSSMNQN